MPNTHTAVPDPRNATVLVYVNGAFVPRAEARVSVFDAGFLVGDGIWEGLRLHHGSFPFLDHHLDRLFDGLKTADITLPHTRAELVALLHEVARRNGMTDGAHLRLMVTRGEKKTPSQHPDLVVGGPTVVIIAEHKAADPEVAARGIRLWTSTIRRPPPDSLDQKLNCHSKMHEVIALVQAYKAGADEALMLDPTGAVATCNATNFFIVRRGEVWTSTGLYNLAGITRQIVLELSRAAGLPTHERPYSLVDVYGADEAFVTGTFGGLTPVVEVDGRSIGSGGPGALTRRLQALYADRLAAEVAG
jgi:branched-chain amino acid aminotransferase